MKKINLTENEILKLYSTNEDVHLYVIKYCNKYKCSIDKALKDAIVQEYILQIIKAERGIL